jgi:hypothetical protein
MINDIDKIIQLLNSADKIIRQYLKSAECAEGAYQNMLISLQNKTVKMKSKADQLDAVTQEYPRLLFEAHYILRQVTQRLESKATVPLLEEGWSPTLAALNRVTNRIRKKLDLPMKYYALQRSTRRAKACQTFLLERRQNHRRQS